MSDSETAAEAGRAGPAKRLKPTKPLPTDRISFPKQVDLLRAFAVAYTTTGRPVTYNDVASIVSMSASTVALAVPFWADIGLMERNDNAHTPSSIVLAFNRGYEWNSETAPHKLAPILRDAWFGKALLPRLAFRSMEEREAIEVLAARAAKKGLSMRPFK